MFGHLPELAIILVLALVVFGPEKLPEVAANAGKIMREARQIVDEAMNPTEHPVPDDFSSYYYDSMERAGEDVPEARFADGDDVALHDVHMPDPGETDTGERATGSVPVQEPANRE